MAGREHGLWLVLGMACDWYWAWRVTGGSTHGARVACNWLIARLTRQGWPVILQQLPTLPVFLPLLMQQVISRPCLSHPLVGVCSVIDVPSRIINNFHFHFFALSVGFTLSIRLSEPVARSKIRFETNFLRPAHGLPNVQDLDFKDQDSIWRNTPGRKACRTIGIIWGAFEIRHFALLHVQASLIPAFDNLCTSLTHVVRHDSMPYLVCRATPRFETHLAQSDLKFEGRLAGIFG